MHADLSRITFRPGRHYSAVVAQQGRVQLDADANEQAAIQLQYARTTAADLIGQHGGPSGATGFEITLLDTGHELDDLFIGGGRYYVDGILCDAHRPRPGPPVPDGDEGRPPAEPARWTYWDQPDGFRDPERPADRLPSQFPYLVYLKVWERTVTAAEDPMLREVALGSAMPDTTARVKVVWQVLALPGSALGLVNDNPARDEIRVAFGEWAQREGSVASRMAARSRRPDHAADEPCLVRPDAQYRGPENQLYRVEIHDGGPAGEATFTWSRENGSVTFPVDELDGTWIELAALGSDDKLDLKVGDWVEFVDTAYSSRLEPLPLLRVEELDLPRRRVRLSDEPAPSVGRRPELHPFLRRWDHRVNTREGSSSGRLRHGAVPIEEGRWLPLEDGVEVYFASTNNDKLAYRTGDFWLIPARTTTGDVEWPTDAARRPLLEAPSGITVHYAPLAWIRDGQTKEDLRLVFPPLSQEPTATPQSATYYSNIT